MGSKNKVRHPIQLIVAIIVGLSAGLVVYVRFMLSIETVYFVLFGLNDVPSPAATAWRWLTAAIALYSLVIAVAAGSLVWKMANFLF